LVAVVGKVTGDVDLDFGCGTVEFSGSVGGGLIEVGDVEG